jgi:hypothetical protein
MDVYVFDARDVYESYLRKTKLASHTAATGIADGGRNLVVVCAQGLTPDAVRGVVLHELAHLFQYNVTPVVMPSWYSEGFAESFGADGAFVWDGSAIRFETKVPEPRMALLRSEGGGLPLETLLRSDALDLIAKDLPTARRFYAQSHAFYRYLKSFAPKETRAAFETWEGACRAAALGAEAGKPYARDTAPASDLFRSRVASDLPALEAGFRAWLSGS